MEHTQGKLKQFGAEIYSENEHGSKLVACCDIALNTKKEEDEANAKHLVKCWNSHKGLVEALEDIARGELQVPNFENYAIGVAKQALKQAEEE